MPFQDYQMVFKCIVCIVYSSKLSGTRKIEIIIIFIFYIEILTIHTIHSITLLILYLINNK